MHSIERCAGLIAHPFENNLLFWNRCSSGACSDVKWSSYPEHLPCLKVKPCSLLGLLSPSRLNSASNQATILSRTDMDVSPE